MGHTDRSAWDGPFLSGLQGAARRRTKAPEAEGDVAEPKPKRPLTAYQLFVRSDPSNPFRSGLFAVPVRIVIVPPHRRSIPTLCCPVNGG